MRLGFIFLWSLWFTTLAFGNSVELTSVDGAKIQATVLGREGDSVSIEKPDGQRFQVLLARFSEESKAIINKVLSSENEAATLDASVIQTVNGVMGISLLGEALFWSDRERSVIARLGWPNESKTDRSSSYRIYPKPDARILGARPHSAVAYFSGGLPEMVSIIFANKGDSFKEAPSPGVALRFIEKAIESDAETIETLLTKSFGEPRRQSLGEGKETRVRASRWDVASISILLSEKEGEYVGLQILPSEVADNRGIAARISDTEARNQAKGNVERRPNGDVLVGNIPMVDQGPKGYCVPATFERYIRYMGLTTDMYLLALAGQTQAGGGTSPARLLEGVSSMLRRNNRSLSEIRKMPDMRTVKKYIDEGRPLMWTLFSTSHFNSLSNARTHARAAATDWDEWEKSLREPRRDIKNRSVGTSGAHMALIIGYNDDTGEIAFSDSWGSAYKERWLTEEELVAFSQGFNYVIDF